MPPLMQAADAGRLFQQITAITRLGVDQRIDLALTDDTAGPRPCCHIGKNELHITRPHHLAIDPEG